MGLQETMRRLGGGRAGTSAKAGSPATASDAAGENCDEEDEEAKAAAAATAAEEGGEGDEEDEDKEEAKAGAAAADSEEEDDEEKAKGGEGDATAQAFALMRSPEAKGREALASELAEDVARGKMTAKRAKSILAAAPKGTAGRLASAMEGRDKNPGQDAPAAASTSGSGKLTAAESKLVSFAGKAFGKKKSA